MSEIIFLTLEEVLVLHEDAITFAGGESGLRSLDLLQSAIAQPDASFGGQPANSFPFGMAAAYAFHLSRNHAFVDGKAHRSFGCSRVPLHEWLGVARSRGDAPSHHGAGGTGVPRQAGPGSDLRAHGQVIERWNQSASQSATKGL